MCEEMKKDLMEDQNDDGLKAVMGDKFQDDSKLEHQGEKPVMRPAKKKEPVMERKLPTHKETVSGSKNHSPAVDGEWTPFPAEAPGWYDRVIGCVKWAAICGGISTLLLLFWINELMAAQAAVPCVCACMTLAGYGVGKHTK